MTKASKTILIIAGICIAMSVVLLFAAVLLGGAQLKNSVLEGIETEIFGFTVDISTDGVTVENDNNILGNSGNVISNGYETETIFSADEIITELDINWVSGDVSIEIGGDAVKVLESSQKAIKESEAMKCIVENGVLKIDDYLERIVSIEVNDKSKNLVVTIPEHYVQSIDDISVSTVSADVNIGALTPNELDIETTSGKIILNGTAANEAELETVSGDIVVGDSSIIDSLCAETTSGNVKLKLKALPRETELDTVSGEMEILTAENSDFELKFETVSGELKLDYPSVKSGDKFIVGNGERKIAVDTTSGDIHIGVLE